MLFLLTVGLCLTVTHASTIESPSETKKHPLILVPGFGGCRAYFRHKSVVHSGIEQVWLNLSHVPSVKDLTNLLKLNYDAKQKKTFDNNDVEVTFPGWGDTTNVEYLDQSEHILGEYFGNIVYEMKKDSYFVSNKTIRAAPYDFRRAPYENNNFIEKFGDLIEETFRINGNRSVVLVGHSMGTLYITWFLSTKTVEWKEQHVEAFVSLSGPYGGAVKAMQAVLSGHNLNTYILPPLMFRELERSMPSTEFLMPSDRLWSNKEPIVITPSRQYTAHDTKELFDDIKFPDGYEIMVNSKREMDFFSSPTGIKKIYCVYGTGVKTAEKLVYLPPWLLRRPFPDQNPTIRSGDGDGSVNRRSLEVCKNWVNTISINLQGVNHQKIRSDPTMLQLLRELTGFSQ